MGRILHGAHIRLVQSQVDSLTLFLDSSQKWDHAIVVLLCLEYFT